METLLGKDPEKSKEKLLTFLLFFLILLVPMSILSETRKPDIEITGLYTKNINGSSREIFFEIQNKINEKLYCKVSVSYYKGNILYNKELKEIGTMEPGQRKVGSVVLHFPGGESTVRIKPECFVAKV
ncbi:hypothetical protein DRJ48_03150 [Candidatus Woesearchaeota archaeon]|nr:hypothetical protein [Candidatus Woesearchaeota archaeon]RLE42620.1 MAG: hypothetical protein DRJ48_03150 [Candidatus Woesearchaeota archaeon]